MVLQDAPHCHAPIHPPAPVPTPSAHPALPLAIIKGEFTVLIGSQPAARLTDTTAPCTLRDDILEGILGCTNRECRREYPIIDGIPVLVGAIRGWLAGNPLQILLRDDLSPAIESLLAPELALIAEGTRVPGRCACTTAAPCTTTCISSPQ